MRAMPAPEAASIVRVADFRPCDCIPIGFNRKRFVSDSLHFRSSRCEKMALKQLPLRGTCRRGAWGRRRQTGFDVQTVPRNTAQGQTPPRGCLRWCLVVILFSFRKKIDSGYVYRVYGVLEGSSRTTFAAAHVVQGEGGYGGNGTLPRYRQPCGVGGY